MIFKQISNFYYEFFVDNNELEERGIKKELSSFNSKEMDLLLKDCIDELKKDTDAILAGEPVFEFSLIKEGLNIKISWIKVIPGSASSKTSSAGFISDNNYLPSSSDNTDLVGDMLSALGGGNIIDELSKYLNKDFLQELINASSTDTLEDVINNFLDSFSEKKSLNVVDAAISNVSPNEYKKRMEKYIEKTDRIRGIIPEPKKKEEQNEIALVMLDFQSIDDIETFIEKNNLQRFDTESILTKSSDGYYHLILDMGKLTPVVLADILVKFISLDNASIISMPNLWSIKEHDEILIPFDAIDKLA